MSVENKQALDKFFSQEDSGAPWDIQIGKYLFKDCVFTPDEIVDGVAIFSVEIKIEKEGS